MYKIALFTKLAKSSILNTALRNGFGFWWDI